MKFVQEEVDKHLYLVAGDYWIKITGGDIIALVALIGLIFTAYFSYRAIKESKRASILEFIPVISIKILNEGIRGDRYKLEVVNVGNSTAYDVRIEDSYHLMGARGATPSIPTVSKPTLDILKCERIGMVKPNDTEKVDCSKSLINTAGYSEELLVYRLTESKSKSKLRIRYKDASGVTYLSVVTVFEGRFRIIKPPHILSKGKWLTYRLFIFVAYCERIILHTCERAKYRAYKIESRF